MSDTSDLVERLTRRLGVKTVTVGPGLYEDIQEAATALEAKEAEIAVLREKLRVAEEYADIVSRWGKNQEARVETAERELTLERETFQLHEQTLRNNGIGSHSEAVVMVTKLRCELHEARAALRPFSDAAESLSEDHLDRMDLWESPAGMEITAGHLRAARAVIEKE